MIEKLRENKNINFITGLLVIASLLVALVTTLLSNNTSSPAPPRSIIQINNQTPPNVNENSDDTNNVNTVTNNNQTSNYANNVQVSAVDSLNAPRTTLRIQNTNPIPAVAQSQDDNSNSSSNVDNSTSATDSDNNQTPEDDTTNNGNADTSTNSIQASSVVNNLNPPPKKKQSTPTPASDDNQQVQNDPPPQLQQDQVQVGSSQDTTTHNIYCGIYNYGSSDRTATDGTTFNGKLAVKCDFLSGGEDNTTVAIGANCPSRYDVWTTTLARNDNGTPADKSDDTWTNGWRNDLNTQVRFSMDDINGLSNTCTVTFTYNSTNYSVTIPTDGSLDKQWELEV